MLEENDFPESKKMTVIFRVEPGSLGPDGANYIDEFCEFAYRQLQASAAHYINWKIVPRWDKNLAEMEFQLTNKKLNKLKADTYLSLFDNNLVEFEEQLENNLEAIINQYFGR